MSLKLIKEVKKVSEYFGQYSVRHNKSQSEFEWMCALMTLTVSPQLKMSKSMTLTVSPQLITHIIHSFFVNLKGNVSYFFFISHLRQGNTSHWAFELFKDRRGDLQVDAQPVRVAVRQHDGSHKQHQLLQLQPKYDHLHCEYFRTQTRTGGKLTFSK